MMTFLPLEDFLQSALSLDDKRLQNQRTEARFVLEWLEGRGFELEAYGAARMWKGYRDALAAYYNACLEAYELRGGSTRVQSLPGSGCVSASSSTCSSSMEKRPLILSSSSLARSSSL